MAGTENGQRAARAILKNALHAILLVAVGATALATVDLVEQWLAPHVEHRQQAQAMRDIRSRQGRYQRRAKVLDRRIEDFRVQTADANAVSPKTTRMSAVVGAAGTPRSAVGLPIADAAPPSLPVQSTGVPEWTRALTPPEQLRYRMQLLADRADLQRSLDDLESATADPMGDIGHGSAGNLLECGLRGDCVWNAWLDAVAAKGTYAHAVVDVGNLLLIFFGYASLAGAGVVFIGGVAGLKTTDMIGGLKDWLKGQGTQVAALALAGGVAAGAAASTQSLPDAHPGAALAVAPDSVLIDDKADATSTPITVSSSSAWAFAVTPDSTAALEHLAAAIRNADEHHGRDQYDLRAVLRETARMRDAVERSLRLPQSFVMDATQYGGLASAMTTLNQSTQAFERSQSDLAGLIASQAERIVNAVGHTTEATQALTPPIAQMNQAIVAVEQTSACAALWQERLHSRNLFKKVFYWMRGTPRPCP